RAALGERAHRLGKTAQRPQHTTIFHRLPGLTRELGVNEWRLAVFDRVAGDDVSVHGHQINLSICQSINQFCGVAVSVVSSPSSRVNLNREVITSWSARRRIGAVNGPNGAAACTIATA